MENGSPVALSYNNGCYHLGLDQKILETKTRMNGQGRKAIPIQLDPLESRMLMKFSGELKRSPIACGKKSLWFGP